MTPERDNQVKNLRYVVVYDYSDWITLYSLKLI